MALVAPLAPMILGGETLLPPASVPALPMAWFDLVRPAVLPEPISMFRLGLLGAAPVCAHPVGREDVFLGTGEPSKAGSGS